MKAILFDTFGPPEVLRVADVSIPEIRPDDLLVRVAAAGVNRADILQRTGFYGSQSFGESALLGLEVAGEVVAVGANVTDIQAGDRVMAIVGGGAYAEFARVDRAMAVRIPRGLSFVDAAAVMESFVTAFEAVSHLAWTERGQTLLVHAAAGGIGSACVQVGQALGATVLATASGARRSDVERIGATAVFDYKTQDFAEEVKAFTSGQGVDAIIDFVGGPYLEPNLRSLKPGGTLVQVGILSGEDAPVIPLNLVLHNHLRLVGTVMKSRTPDEKRAMVQRFADNLLPHFETRRLSALIESSFPLEAAAEAHTLMERGGGFGKIVLTMD